MAEANMYVLNPVFQTRSFDDMVKPLTMYVNAYKEQEAKIEDMTDKAAALEWIANQNPESQTAALYRDMSDKIQGIRDDIMMNGLTGGLRSRVLDTRKIYSANSQEITRRYQDMVKYRERMEQMYDKDNSMVFSPESQNVGIDDFAGGKRPKIKAISGNEIMARGAAVGKRLTSLVFGDGVAGTEAGEQFWKFYKENGMTDEALAAALDNIGQSSKYSLVKKIIDGVYDSFKDFAPGDQQTLKLKFIEGVYAGAVYSRDVTYQPNGEYVNKYQRDSLSLQQQDLARQNLALELQGRAGGWLVDTKTGTITKDYSQPDTRIVENKDGSKTVMQVPYNPDGSIDTAGITTTTIDKAGNVVNVSRGAGAGGNNATNGANDGEPGWGARKVAPQSKTELTDSLKTQVTQQGDTQSYFTLTDSNGNVNIVPITKLGSWAGRKVLSPVTDWGHDYDPALNESRMWGSRMKSKYRKWIKIEPGKMPKSVNAAYQRALNKFVSTAEATESRNIANYDVYCLMDPENLNRPIEFRFESHVGSTPFKTVESDNEALAILNVRKFVEEATAAGKGISDEAVEKAYNMGLDEGKVARYAGASTTKTTTTRTQVKQDTVRTSAPQQSNNATYDSLMNAAAHGGMSLKK